MEFDDEFGGPNKRLVNLSAKANKIDCAIGNESTFSLNSNESGSVLGSIFASQPQLSLSIGKASGPKNIFKDPSNFSEDVIPENASKKSAAIASFLDDLDIKQVSIREAIDSFKKIESNEVV